VNSTTDAIGVLERCQALAVRMPPQAFFCSVTAAVIMRVPLPQSLVLRGKLHVGVPFPDHPPEVKGVVGHRLRRTGKHTRLWNGLRVSEPELVWCELATELSLPDLVAAGDHLIHWRLPATTAERLADAVDAYPGRRGRPAMRAALALFDDRAESRMESHLRVILIQAGFTGLESNFEITTRDGTHYRADFAFPRGKLLVEYQGAYHSETEQFRRDMTRIARLQADGWYVMQVNADDLRNPRELADRIRRVLSERLAR
jgi:very-short-patch-repair endonuclease